jgi:hypothetical protein
LSHTEDPGTLESLMSDIAALQVRWPVYQLSSM